VKNRAKFIFPQIAGCVASYARCKLYSYMKQCKTIYYCDTDSLITDTDLDTGKKLGDLELQHHGDGVFLLPKVYGFKDPSLEKPLLKAKGFYFSRYEGDGGLSLTYDDMVECLDFKRFQELFRQQKERLAPFMTCFTRCSIERIGDLMSDMKSIQKNYSKRVVSDDGIHTEPVYLEDFDSEWEDR
jgi:hypothetical protein